MSVELPLRSVRVLEQTELRAGTRLLVIEPTGPFVPGQCVGLTVDTALPARSYSICSAPGASRMEILYDIVRQGELTPRLSSLAAGDTVLATTPFGAFRDHPGVSVWIATGTGVAPFVSMARGGDGQAKTLVHGARTLDGLYYRELFERVLGTRYVPCCTRETSQGVHAGRVTTWLETASLDPAARYLLCGSAEMVVDVRDLLIRRGVPYTRISGEVYF